MGRATHEGLVAGSFWKKPCVAAAGGVCADQRSDNRAARARAVRVLSQTSTRNAAKLNNAWWRCTRSGNCNTPAQSIRSGPVKVALGLQIGAGASPSQMEIGRGRSAPRSVITVAVYDHHPPHGFGVGFRDSEPALAHPHSARRCVRVGPGGMCSRRRRRPTAVFRKASHYPRSSPVLR